MAYAAAVEHNRGVFDYRCPSCDQICSTELPQRIETPCSTCTARELWESLPIPVQRDIDVAIARGALAGIGAIRRVDPQISLPAALDVIALRTGLPSQL